MKIYVLDFFIYSRTKITYISFCNERKLNINFIILSFSFDRIVGDNVDHEILVRVQTKSHTNRSIHWTHQFAIVDRVQAPELENKESQKPVKEIEFAELLPDQHVQANLLKHWAIIVSRIITKYLRAFQPLRNKVVWHIPHPHSKEMATRSNLVRPV